MEVVFDILKVFYRNLQYFTDSKTETSCYGKISHYSYESNLLAWENSLHFATPNISPQNDWRTDAEIPYWWRHHPDPGSASDWSYREGSTFQIWVVTRHQYGISVLVSPTSFRGPFRGKTSGGIAKCRLFSPVMNFIYRLKKFSTHHWIYCNSSD